MKGNRGRVLLACVLALVILACGVSVDLGNAPLATPTGQLSSLDQISTFTVQTLQALTQTAITPTSSSTPTATNTPAPVTLSVSSATNCYAGPRTNYGFVITIYPGMIVSVVGRDPADNYYVIDVPGYPGTVCWLSGQYAALNGDMASLPIPATPQISKYTLSEPRALHTSCSSEELSGTPEPWWHDAAEWTVVVRWRNSDPDQTGVRIYKNGHHIATLGARASSYTDSFFHNRHHGVTYGVQVFNSSEVSSIVTVSLNHCD